MSLRVVRAEQLDLFNRLTDLVQSKVYTASIQIPGNPTELVVRTFFNDAVSIDGNGKVRSWSYDASPRDFENTKLYNLVEIGTLDITATEVGVCPF